MKHLQFVNGNDSFLIREKNRSNSIMEPEKYQLLILRSHGGKPIMKISPMWIKLLGISFVVLLIAVIAGGIHLAQINRTNTELIRRISAYSGENKQLSINIAQKEQEIISLKNKLSPTIVHQADKVPGLAPEPELLPPIAEIDNIVLKNQELYFRIQNIKKESNIIVKGQCYVVFKMGDILECLPETELIRGIPQYNGKGIEFSIRNYRPVKINAPQGIADWESATFYIFDDKKKLRLATPVKKEKIKNIS